MQWAQWRLVTSARLATSKCVKRTAPLFRWRRAANRSTRATINENRTLSRTISAISNSVDLKCDEARLFVASVARKRTVPTISMLMSDQTGSTIGMPKPTKRSTCLEHNVNTVYIWMWIKLFLLMITSNTCQFVRLYYGALSWLTTVLGLIKWFAFDCDNLITSEI